MLYSAVLKFICVSHNSELGKIYRQPVGSLKYRSSMTKFPGVRVTIRAAVFCISCKL